MKRIITLILAGMLLGVIIGSLAGPGLIRYWYEPPISNQSFSCTREIDWAMTTLVKTQLIIGGLVTTGLTITVKLVASYLRKRKSAKTATQPSSSPGPSNE